MTPAEEEAQLRVLLQHALPPSRLQNRHIRAAMERWQASVAERAAREGAWQEARAAEHDAYQYLVGCLLAMQPVGGGVASMASGAEAPRRLLERGREGAG